MALACLLALCIPPQRAFAAWQNFKAASGGLGNNLINQVSEDRQGGLWFATVDGASAFDGTRWSFVADSLPDRRVYSILASEDGQLWFGTQAGIAILDGATWSRVSAANGRLPADPVYAILQDHRGDVWVGTSGGLGRYEPASDRWTSYAQRPGGLVYPQVFDLLEDSRSRLWIGTAFGVSMLDSTRAQWTTFTADPNALGRDSVLCLAEDGAGRIWFGTDQGAWSYGDDGWRHWTSADGLPGNLILSMARDRQGHLWLGGLNGVSHGDGVTFRYDRLTSDGALIGPVNALHVDGSGNVWMGGLTYEYLGVTSQGVYRFDGVAWRNYFYTDPSAGCIAHPSPNIPTSYTLPGNCLTAGMQDHAGEMWFGTLDTGIARLGRGGSWSTVRRSFSIPMSDSISALVEDHEGTLWFGSLGAGLASLDSTRTSWSLLTTANGLPADDVVALAVDARGELWMGSSALASRRTAGGWVSYSTGGSDQFAEDAGGRMWIRSSAGLYTVDSARTIVRTWTTQDGLLDNYPTAMLAARDGSMWFGTSAGVSRLSGGSWSSSPGTPVHSIREDAAGNVWAASDGDLSKWDGASWETFRAPAQLPGLPVLDVDFEPNGVAWAATPTGIGRYNGRSWKKLDSKGNGLTVDEIVGVVTDTQHRMWVMGVSGLAEYEPDLTAPQTVFVNTNEKVSPSRNVSLVFGAAYGELADLEYRTRWDAEPWSDWTSDNTWYRQGVADGPHTFSVYARDWAGNEDPTPATYSFEIDATPPLPDVSVQSVGITTPQGASVVRGACTVVGTTADARFRSYVVEARPLGATAWNYSLAAGTAPVTDDTLATWDTTPLPDGDYEIRVAVDDTLGLTGVARARVIVDNVAPFANVTSPVRLVASEGGDVYTTNAEAHVYFPPNAFDADPTVSVDSLDAGAAPDTLPGGAVRRGPAWAIAWTGGTIQKAGVLELRPWEKGGPLAVWRKRVNEPWTRLGGSPVEGSALALNLDHAGNYALFAETVAPATGGALSALTLTPRAFSPRGSFASTNVAIGFSLARPGGATVKLYNRAGRLMRVVASGFAGNAGENIVRWDGRDDDGRTVDAGLYLVTVEALGQTLTRPLAVVQ